MIISASRRTDLPAFYAPWLIRRLRSGYCNVPNPFNPAQVNRVSLQPESVDCLVFWTRNPRPLCRLLKEIDAMGYRYYFLLTVLDNPRSIDPYAPRPAAAVAAFRELAAKIGPERIIWRYDPIVLTHATDIDFHTKRFATLAAALAGATRRVTISFTHVYRKLGIRLRKLEVAGLKIRHTTSEDLEAIVPAMVRCATDNGMILSACAAEPVQNKKYNSTNIANVYPNTLSPLDFGAIPGCCIDADLVATITGRPYTFRKDTGQRKNCGCTLSKDIGMYDTCLFGCRYCYAVTNFTTAANNRRRHDQNFPSMIPPLPIDLPVKKKNTIHKSTSNIEKHKLKSNFQYCTKNDFFL